MPALTEEQVSQFHEEGYLLLEDLFDPEEVLDPLAAEYETVLERLANELFNRGEISSTYAELPFAERLIRVYQESGRVHAGYFDFSLPQSGITYRTPMWHGPAVFNVLTNPDILDAVESIVGPEIYSNPVQHVRIKPPEHMTPVDPKTGRIQLGATPWHQDNGVITEDADETEMLTVWMPIWDADERAGCLQVVPRSHREGLLTHCPGGAGGFGLHIPDSLFRVQDAVPVPMKRGSALLMHRRTCHASLSNHSDNIRWSLDLRYNPTGQHTGRESFPGFVARSRSAPQSELHDAGEWALLWREARFNLARQADPRYNRWDGSDPACA